MYNAQPAKCLSVNTSDGILTASIMDKLGIIKEFWQFIRARKKWWLLVVSVCILLLGSIIVLSQGSAAAPFIYTIF